MSLQDVLGNADLSLFPQVALVLFLLAFLAVAVRVLIRPHPGWERAARLPLDEREESA